MYKIVVFLVILFSSCSGTKKAILDKDIHQEVGDYTYQALELAFDTLPRYKSDTIYVFDTLFLNQNIRFSTYGQANFLYYNTYIDTSEQAFECHLCEDYFKEILTTIDKRIEISKSALIQDSKIKFVTKFSPKSYTFSPLMHDRKRKFYFLWATYHFGSSDWDVDYLVYFKLIDTSLQLTSITPYHQRNFNLGKDYLKDAKF